MKVIGRVKRKLVKLRLQPIRVFCFHHVSEKYDSSFMKIGDWYEIGGFKQRLLALQKEGVSFISLKQAFEHMKDDLCRMKKYAVITFDDGYKDVLNVLPWLEENRIPSTLFINGKYLDGKSYRDDPLEKYITEEELFSLNSNFVEIANHGWEHVSVNDLTDEEFSVSVIKNKELLSKHPCYVDFWAYTYGNYRKETDRILSDNGLVGVLINGGVNYDNTMYVDRELMR